MAHRLTDIDIVTIKNLADRGVPKAQIARQLGVTAGAVRYQLNRLEDDASPGCAKPMKLDPHRTAVDEWRASREGCAVNLADLHTWLEREHDYEGSMRSVQRAWRQWYGVPKIRARRRIETPPGAQAQVDWAHFPRMRVGTIVNSSESCIPAGRTSRWPGSRLDLALFSTP